MSVRPATPIVAGTRQRLLDAAARVFARSGLEGATTREIAREAKVNEVTLFRHFQTKDNLLSEVVRRTFDRQEETFAAPTPSAAVRAGGGLRASLGRFAQRYAELLESNLPFIRTLIGASHRHREHEVRAFKGIFHPLKAELLAAIESAQQRGLLRPGVEARVAADVFGSMIFTEVLRRASPHCPDYPDDLYRETCVDVFVRGIENRRPARTRAPRVQRRP